MTGNEMPKVEARAQLAGLGAPEVHFEARPELSVGWSTAVADGTAGSAEIRLALSL
jgi:hypothetical protein